MSTALDLVPKRLRPKEMPRGWRLVRVGALVVRLGNERTGGVSGPKAKQMGSAMLDAMHVVHRNGHNQESVPRYFITKEYVMQT